MTPRKNLLKELYGDDPDAPSVEISGVVLSLQGGFRESWQISVPPQDAARYEQEGFIVLGNFVLGKDADTAWQQAVQHFAGVRSDVQCYFMEAGKLTPLKGSYSLSWSDAMRVRAGEVVEAGGGWYGESRDDVIAAGGDAPIESIDQED